ncbi:lipid-A-disaccharide synthase [Pararobbsia silviterrae]|uniref:Lipid-A-disaccharide synthase n=1 Tax=Pararobbsia silviterrae TaxID=1792498 RepID=A0A494XXM4_9BURK|nr:lipid-A-disaccharide synthase [Pararobbsia silviterrae]RKP54665.1 lipid-A-disaccharide synthase [Pararobbsia silviterrae]
MSMRLAMVAGEASGDLLAASLLGGLHRHLPADTRYYGIGGPRMAAEGFDAQWPMDKLSVRGYVEALRHIPEILGIRNALKRALLADPPSAFIGVDAPDFNFGLEAPLRKAGIPTIHFVSPSIWAWRGGRIHSIARSVDHMLCVFPFETEIYAKAQVPATYVGHPLADTIPMTPDPGAARTRLGIDVAGKIIGVMPGSRRSEIALIGPVFFAAMDRIHRREPGIRFLLPAASPTTRALLQPLVDAYPALPLTIIDGRSHDVLEASDAMLIKSGTSTLEAALYKKPMVISYKVPWLTGQIMRRQGYLPWVGLPNILARRFLVPELLQEFATPETLADAMLEQLNNETHRADLIAEFTRMHESLRRNTAETAAAAIAEIIATHAKRGGQV